MIKTPPSFKTGEIDPALLAPNPWNVNKMSPDNEAKLENSIKRFGLFKPVVVRELANGVLEILGGEHRAQTATRLGIKVPFINLGRVDDNRAKEISLVDNGRFGADDTLQLAELLEGLGNAGELATFMPYTDADLASIFSSVNIALDDLGFDEDDEIAPSLPKEKPLQTHQIMRFKVPVGDVQRITDQIDRVMKAQKYVDADSLTNVGDAFVYICGKASV